MHMPNMSKNMSSTPSRVPPGQLGDSNSPFFSDTAGETFWYSKKGKILVSFYVLLIVVALEVGVFMYAIGAVKSDTSASTVEKPFRGSVSAVTPAAVTPGMETYTVTILNGSGIAGTAADARELLKGENLMVQSIGNASSSASQNTSIQVLGSVPEAFVDKIKNALSKRYIMDDIVTYSEATEAEVVIIIGRNKIADHQP